MKTISYFYYSKNDLKKEPIDKVTTLNETDAISYFANRKKMSKEVFMNLYNVEVYEETKSK